MTTEYRHEGGRRQENRGSESKTLRVGGLDRGAPAEKSRYKAKSQFHPLLGARGLRRRITDGLVSSLSASFPTQRATELGEPARRRATAMAAALSVRLRFPMARRAMFADFLTKLRSSLAARSMSVRPSTNGSSPVRLSCTLRLHSRANAVRLTNSSLLLLQCVTLAQACGVRSNRLKHIVSQMPQLSKSLHQRSICAGVTCDGSSTKEATMRASYTPVPQRAAASSWFVPSRLPNSFISLYATPNALSDGIA